MSERELRELIASLATAQAKTDENLNKLKEAQAKTDEGLNKLKEAQAKTDEQLKKTDEQLKKASKELREMFERSEERLKKTDARLDRVAAQLGGIAKNQGDVAEEFFVNSLKETLRIGKINFDLLLENVGLNIKRIHDEFDILLVNGDSVAIVEVKYKVHPNDLNLLPKKIEHLKQMPQYQHYRVYAGLAGFYVPGNVIEEAQKRGYFILQRKGDIIVSHIDHLRAA